MRDALQRDAAQVPKPDFDPQLHYSTMRRIRERAEPSVPQWNLIPLFTSAVVVALLASIAFWQMRSSPENKIATPSQPDRSLPTTVPPTVSRASLLAYQTAANEGDAALFALLDRDATSLLPASAPVFTTPLP